ncbi:MAG: tRNA threonylcarbamoyladenosine biosynthesis protein RimN [Gammaproteobacteria bacterium]|nr:tRNA threonylcarbamoyladenosine biosynthesis protein RimN [Gammaproteobacteria bacterium]
MPSSEVEKAVKFLQQGGVVAHATEGVWGLACDPWNETAVNRILTIKKRSNDLGFIVIGADSCSFQEELDAVDPEIRRKVVSSWPGHVTWILPSHRFPDWVTGKRTSVAVRVPDHKQARKLAMLFGKPVISTSANISGSEPALTMEEVCQKFGEFLDFVLPGEIGTAVGPSRIRNAVYDFTIR